MGSKSDHKYPCKREEEGEGGDRYRRGKGGVKTETTKYVSSHQKLEDKEWVLPTEPLEGTQPNQRVDFSPVKLTLHLSPQEL